MGQLVVEGDTELPWTRLGVGSTRGVVAAAHPLAAQAGARVLREGGNAFDAAVATAAALNVVEPYMSGLAGQGAVTCFVASERAVRTLDFVPPVPRDIPSLEVLAGLDFSAGSTACAVPGNLAGWFELSRAHGNLPFAQLLEPAIELATDGFPLTSLAVRTITKAYPDFRSRPRELFDRWIRTYGDGHGGVPAANFVLRQPRLAATLAHIQESGIEYLYGGPLGREFVRVVQEHGGFVGMADLDAVQPTWHEPATGRYRDLEVATLPPPAESFQFLLTLAILEHVDVATLDHNGLEHLDTVIRAIRLAAIERITNNRPSPAALEALLGRASDGAFTERLTDRFPIEGPTEQFPIDGSVGSPHRSPGQHTTSLSVADREGNVVCITQSLGSVFGCGVVLDDYGVCLNNFLKWGERTQGSTNPLRPSDRLALPIAPSIATRDGRPVLALGTPGSYGIAQTQTQVLLQHVDFSLSIQEAIEEPRARVKDGREVLVERRIAPDVLAGLSERGHGVVIGSLWTREVGGAQAVELHPDTGVMVGGFDPRRDGYVATP